jgi:predicted Holliday junction resolvase-like endonuclease
MGVIGVIVALSLAFVLVAVLAIGWVREVLKSKTAEMRHQQEIKEQRADAVKRSRSVIEGQVFEQLVPHFPEWNHTPSEARFLSRRYYKGMVR